MQVTVMHNDHETGTLVPVARITIPDTIKEIWQALDYAWRWTNNVEGSWSRGELIEHYNGSGSLVDNGDYNPNTEVLAPLPVYKGKTYGLRSSMVGDIFVIDGTEYRVASMGFETLDGTEVA